MPTRLIGAQHSITVLAPFGADGASARRSKPWPRQQCQRQADAQRVREPVTSGRQHQQVGLVTARRRKAHVGAEGALPPHVAMSWMQRLKRVFAIERCRRCGRRIKVIASIELVGR